MAWRTLKLGDSGKAVQGLTRGLHYALASSASSKEQASFDMNVQRDVMVIQRHAGIQADGVVGAATWTALAAVKNPSGRSVLDERAKAFIRLGAREPQVSREEAIRRRCVAGQNLFLSHRILMPYEQVRPFPSLPLTVELARRGTDCSGSVTSIAEYAGAPDPNGHGYNGDAYTGYMRDYAQRRRLFIPLSQGKRGDLCHYGSGRPGDAQHVTMLREDARPGMVPKVFSFGHYPMEVYPANYRRLLFVQRLEVQ